jgi:hypothetical protein
LDGDRGAVHFTRSWKMLAEMGCGKRKGSWRPMLAFGVANLTILR